jgi:hypothetical protein
MRATAMSAGFAAIVAVLRLVPATEDPEATDSPKTPRCLVQPEVRLGQLQRPAGVVRRAALAVPAASLEPPPVPVAVGEAPATGEGLLESREAEDLAV